MNFRLCVLIAAVTIAVVGLAVIVGFAIPAHITTWYVCVGVAYVVVWTVGVGALAASGRAPDLWPFFTAADRPALRWCGGMLIGVTIGLVTVSFWPILTWIVGWAALIKCRIVPWSIALDNQVDLSLTEEKRR